MEGELCSGGNDTIDYWGDGNNAKDCWVGGSGKDAIDCCGSNNTVGFWGLWVAIQSDLVSRMSVSGEYTY